MADRGPLVHLDARAAAEARRRGQDPHELDRCIKLVLRSVYASLPATPVVAAARLAALPGADPSGEDRLSALPFALLRDIASRLPIKDAARTAALSRRWRPVWRCSPLVFADAHLLPGLRAPAGLRAATPGLVAAASRVLAAHPGPFRAVHLVFAHMDAHQRQLARWARTLADKGVQELVLVNRPSPLDVPLPAALLDAAALTRLYLGVWRFPDTSALPRRAAPPFPHLRELVLCCVVMEHRDLDFLLAGSPVLEALGILGSRNPLRLRLAGQRLRCVQVCVSYVESIAVVDAPNLERLFLSGAWTHNGSCIRVRIGKAPKLRLLGYLQPGVHMLEIRDTVITAGIRASPSSMAPNVKILGLNVRFGVQNDAKMLPVFLKCFRNVENLYILSEKSKEVTSKLNLKFWQESGPIESMRSSIKAITFREFRGEQSELVFLKFFFQSAQVLKNAVIVTSNGAFKSIMEVISKVLALAPAPGSWGSKCKLTVCEGKDPEGGGLWNFQTGFDFSVSDPFAYH
ncbi:hypothetical protein ACP4OV_028998 [Aristida adscensionis]